MTDFKAVKFYIGLLAKDDQPLENIIEGMVLEAEATKGHFTMQEALAVLLVNRRIRGILDQSEATRLFDKLIK